MTRLRSALAVGVIMALAVLVSACTVYVNGNPYTVALGPPTATIDPTPTADYATEVPRCVITARDTDINVRAVPGGDVIGLFEIMNAAEPLAITRYDGLNYYKIAWAGGYGWIADFVVESGYCGWLPYVPIEQLIPGAIP